VHESPEKELQEFLAALPLWEQKVIQARFSELTGEDAVYWTNCDPSQIEQHKQEYERMIQGIRGEWKKYRQRLEAHNKIMAPFGITFPLPKGTPGRKRETQLAERIWQLRDEGNTVPQMQAILQAEGEHCSKEKIEAYLKTRRRPGKSR